MLKKKEIVIADFNFNFLCKILDSGDFNSSPVTRWFDNYILDSVFRIKEVHKSRFLFSLYKSLNEKYNLKKHSSDLDIFYCMTSGGKSPSHSENYDVYIIGVEGIGPKRAQGLAKEHKTFETLIKAFPIKGRAKYIQNLNSSRDLLERNEKLINLKKYNEDAIVSGKYGEEPLDVLSKL